MITDSFDPQGEALMNPGTFYGEKKHLCDVCIATFSRVLFEKALNTFPCEAVGEIKACNGSKFIYTFPLDGKTCGLYLSGVGSTVAGNDLIEASWLTGATKFVLFGSAGCLNQPVTQGKYVLPTQAYRDEGMSYHYAAPADYIDVPGNRKLAALFEEMHLPYVQGRIWSTDAFYRETRALVAARQKEGCLAVEMEIAGVQAICDFYGFSLYPFLMTGDVLDAAEYDIADLSRANHFGDNLDIALEIAKKV